MVLSVIYPVSTNRSKTDSTNIGLSLFQNSLGIVNGVHFAGISAVSRGRVTGIQTAFFYSQINNRLKGISLATINVVGDDVSGIQGSYAANLTGKSLVGYQVAGVINFLGGSLKGLQQSAVFNIVGKSFKGVQTAGAGNVVGGNFLGVQIGTTFNFVGKTMKGVQLGAANICGELRGLQMGYGNIAQVNHGWQIGLFNLAEIQDGIPIGLINISDDGNISWLNYCSNYADFLTAVRFRSGNFISSLEIGTKDVYRKRKESIIFGFHYGYRIPIFKLALEADLGYDHLFRGTDDQEDKQPDELAVQLRFSLSYSFNKWLALFAGVGNTTIMEYDVKDKAENHFLYFTGISIF